MINIFFIVLGGPRSGGGENTEFNFGRAGREAGVKCGFSAVAPGPSKTSVNLKTKINLYITRKDSLRTSQMLDAEGCGGKMSLF